MQALGQGDGAGDPTHLYRELSGTQHLNEVILVDQSPIGRTPAIPYPVTYIKAFDDIRAPLRRAGPTPSAAASAPATSPSTSPEAAATYAKAMARSRSRCSSSPTSSCPCEECNGTRYKNAILDIKYKAKNIHDVLNMTVKEALVYFAGHPKIVDKLYVLDEVGLGYVRLGQSATTLSGGEAQRVKLASHLATARSISNRSTTNEAAAKARSRTLYILDEPTTGLHFDDVQKLLAAFRKTHRRRRLAPRHRAQPRRYQVRRPGSSTWGQKAASGGGQIVAAGTPEEIAANPRSHTGHWLAPVLNLPTAVKEDGASLQAAG